MPVILATWEVEIRRIVVQVQQGQIVHKTPISKVTRVKWTRGLAQAVEFLLCRSKTVSSNPSSPASLPHKKYPTDTGNGAETG
jgi:hypothetical protein